MEKWKNRLAEFECDPEFISRFSTRAFDPHKMVPHEVLMSCFEAARWAPSCFNNQPWRYLWAKMGTPAYKAITDSMVEFNQSWCKNVPILIVICSRKMMSHNGKPAVTASLDTGASYMSLVLEAHKRGLVTHEMGGFNPDKIAESFNILPQYHIEALLALGYPGPLEMLSKELQERETPSDRLALKETVSENHFFFT